MTGVLQSIPSGLQSGGHLKLQQDVSSPVQCVGFVAELPLGAPYDCDVEDKMHQRQPHKADAAPCKKHSTPEAAKVPVSLAT